MWDDPTWVIQDYYAPIRTHGGEYLSVGISDMGGELGGIYLRAESSPLISARTSSFIPVTVASPTGA
jgi:glutathionylspermidine synthase